MAGVPDARLCVLHRAEPQAKGRFVLYWMQHAQRATNNPALERAAAWANRLKLPLFVLFVLDPDYPDANARHFTFLIEGLQDVEKAVKRRGAHFAIRRGKPADVAIQTARDAAVVVTDRGYLRHLKAWRAELAENAPCLVEMVEGEVIVPVEAASPKKETAARTLRPKIHKALGDFLDLPSTVTLKTRAKGFGSDDDLDIGDVGATVEALGCDASVGPVTDFKGGQSAAKSRLSAFVKAGLGDYADGRSDIVERNVSMLSPYLHLGQISPLEIYHAVKDAAGSSENAKAYVEEMLVRRELAVNFVHYSDDYDRFAGLPGWAQDTLADHKDDPREETYTAKALENGKTSDPYWNAAMREMRVTGYLHNHMRMYWGKRVLGWMKDPKTAHRTLLTLNNKYFLDGRDANSYTNVAWIFGVHDRGWPEREVYGKVRTMKPSGLKRKFDMDAYVRWAEAL